jgi:hypothetical protein
MSKGAIDFARVKSIISRHSALVMFFYMSLLKHVCNAMSQ